MIRARFLRIFGETIGGFREFLVKELAFFFHLGQNGHFLPNVTEKI
jgi:hypothetical protein